MSTIAVGDIHGNLAALRSLLDAVTPYLNAEDTLVFLGDYIDRGPDSKGCIEEILRLKAQGPFHGCDAPWQSRAMDARDQKGLHPSLLASWRLRVRDHRELLGFGRGDASCGRR
jgi:hypothetical protein